MSTTDMPYPSRTLAELGAQLRRALSRAWTNLLTAVKDAADRFTRVEEDWLK